MAIDNNNPLEQENNPDRNGSNGEANTTGTRRRKKPRRDGKGSNTQANNPRTSKSTGSKTRRGGKENQALATQASGNTAAVDPNLMLGGSAEDAAAYAEGGIKAIGDQRIIPFMKLEKPMALLSLLMVLSLIHI